ncbi:MAG: MarR family transcriptional regulator [Actinomycetota bacterium]|nr:MarR family transcriptional regulator [Actinomycetota bacterium]
MNADPLGQLAKALNDLYRLSGSARFHERTVAATGVSVSRSGLRFLSLVNDAGPVSATRLAEGLDLSQPTASRVLQQLEADGLVSRHASTSDGRVSHYLATRKGRRALERVHAYHVSQLEAALDDLDSGSRSALAHAVTELVGRLHREDASQALRTA